MSNDVIVQIINYHLSECKRKNRGWNLTLLSYSVRIIAAAGTAILLSLVPSDLHLGHRYLKHNIPKTVEKIKHQKLF